ncbi:hypothetical protein ACSBR1_025725 [Camellia fascicularis]
MEFKFRAKDGQASTTHVPPSTIGYFTQQALRAGYSFPDFGHSSDFIRNPSNMREAIQRELEKERIREEIIATEIVRKRMLEAELRREMALGSEMALRRGEGFSTFSAQSAMRFEPRLSLLHQSEGRLLEERLALSLEERLGYQAHHSVGGFEMMRFTRNAEPKISEIMPPVEANPKGNLSGAKRKAVTPPAVVGASELPPVGLKKKLKEEWSCALCQVRATSERGLDEHLQGKKHKAMEAGLSAQRTGKNNAIGLFPKKSVKPIKLAETIDNQNSEQEILLQKSNAEDVKQNNDLALQVVKVTNDSKNNSKNKNWNLAHKTNKTGDCKEKRFKFWCEMCQVGACSMKVLGIHKKGKKHMARLQELNQKSGLALTTQVEEAPQNEKCPEVVVKDEKGETTDNVDGDADGEAVENHQTAEDVAGNGTN